MIVKGTQHRRNNNKNKTNPNTRILRRYCHVFTSKIAGEPPAFRGKPHFCKKDTAKRRRDKERLFAMMKFANLRETDNGKRWDWETALHLLNTQTHYPPGCNNYNAFVDMSWKDARIKRTFYSARATYTEPSISNWNDHL
jgi:hypothetical protein